MRRRRLALLLLLGRALRMRLRRQRDPRYLGWAIGDSGAVDRGARRSRRQVSGDEEEFEWSSGPKTDLKVPLVSIFRACEQAPLLRKQWDHD